VSKYKLEIAEPFILNDYPEYVTFKASDLVKFPVLSAVYLSIHAACAKVAHLSGAGACIDKFYRDIGDQYDTRSEQRLCRDVGTCHF
jgi:hypothetical protein